VSSQGDAAAARVLRSFEEQHGDWARFDRALRFLGSKVPPLPMDSQAKHVALAAGAGDLLIRFPPQRDFRDAIWDCAAGSILIEEAGGRVTDVAGRTFDFTTGRRLLRNEGLLASNGLLHDTALAAIQNTA
jgi:3'(2'), 5'-bisphosphate nucleotidase